MEDAVSVYAHYYSVRTPYFFFFEALFFFAAIWRFGGRAWITPHQYG
jgi:hypothetical protein